MPGAPVSRLEQEAAHGRGRDLHRRLTLVVAGCHIRPVEHQPLYNLTTHGGLVNGTDSDCQESMCIIAFLLMNIDGRLKFLGFTYLFIIMSCFLFFYSIFIIISMSIFMIIYFDI